MAKLYSGQKLWGKNGEEVTVVKTYNDSIIVWYKGKKYKGPISSLGKELFREKPKTRNKNRKLRSEENKDKVSKKSYPNLYVKPGEKVKYELKRDSDNPFDRKLVRKIDDTIPVSFIGNINPDDYN